jgi:Amt family ammonium transporter
MPYRVVWAASLAPALALAQSIPPATEIRIRNLEAAVKSARSAGDNAWMLVSAALVLMMTAPGLALFYGGLVRRKNVLGTMMHGFVLIAIVTVIWAIAGYSLAFGEGSGFIGDLRYLFLSNVGAAPNPDYAATIPQQTYMIYQLMFAIITPALISGAFAERMRFSATLLFTVLWLFIVYFPLAHMVWGKDGLLNPFSGGRIPCLDFAGGTVAHISSGVSALVCALAASPLATSAFVAAHFATAAAALGWMFVEWVRNGKPSMLGGISGAVAGLVAITPASGFVKPFPAMPIGFVAGMVCFFMVTTVKSKFGYDDTLDAFGVHGAGRTVGAILTGVFATVAVNDGLKDSSGKSLPLGLIDGQPGQVLNQVLGVAVSYGLAIVGTLVILKICDVLIGVPCLARARVGGSGRKHAWRRRL